MAEKAKKPYSGVVYCPENSVLEDKGYDTPQAAKRAVCRRLFRESPGSRGEVIWTNVTLPKSGGLMKEAVTRDHAVAEMMRKGRTPVTQRKVVGSTANTCKGTTTRVTFSRG